MSRPNALPACTSTRITTATTTAVKARTGIVHCIVIGGGTLGTITLNDGVGTRLVLDATVPRGSYTLNIECASKIEVVTAAATDVTIVWL